MIAVDGHPLAQANVLASLENLLARRARRDSVVLGVMRGPATVSIEVPVPKTVSPSLNPGTADFLQRASHVLRLFTSARYSVTTPGSDGLTARLELRFASRITARPPHTP